MPYAEIRFGYKISESEIRNQDMEVYADGYLLFYNKIWEKINSRNITLHIPQGMLLLGRKAFEESTIREAINNAIIHRDYSERETIFITQTQTKVIIKNPGGLLEGVTPKNIMDESKTRNKLIAEILYKCELVEQFGSGVNLMIKNQLSLGNNPPDYTKSYTNHVVLEIDESIQDMEFAKYVIKVADEKQKQLNDEELRILVDIKNNKRVKAKGITKNLLELGLIEKIENRKYILSKKYYIDTNQKGEYTRRKGLGKNTNKALILEHLKNYKKGYVEDFAEVLKDVPKPTVKRYLQELKEEEKIELIGNPRVSRGKDKAFWKLKK